MTTLKNSRILIVDDEPDVRDILVDIFEEFETIICQASNGKEALEIIQKNRVDLVISDIRMPNGDGVELLCNIKDQDVFKPIVILMSGFMDTSIQDLHNMGADAYFSKPFETERILETAQELILKKSLSI